ncbi:hypothetical protein HYE03_00870 [Mycoplasmopsis bovis]|nr:hypothetical protein [Mycoplasmopsis bovis]QQH27982.1 hypothetical protein HYE03_00870 [Mycoplasmopsis bovis]
MINNIRSADTLSLVNNYEPKPSKQDLLSVDITSIQDANKQNGYATANV